MLFTEEQTKILQNTYSQGTECEIRFGTFSKDNHFNSEVSMDTFHRVKKNLEKFIQPDIQNYTERYSKTVRERTVGDSIEYTTKKQQKKSDNYEFNFRVSLATEESVKKPEGLGELVNKTRWSFTDHLIRYDLTKSGSIYRIELELLGQVDIEWLNTRVLFVLQTIQDNFFLTTHTQRQTLLSNYKKILGCNYFVGAQPESLTRDNIRKLSSESYSVTAKLDGERYLLFCTEGYIYLIDNNMNNIKYTGIECGEFTDSIFDGELVFSQGLWNYYLFDTIAFKGLDLRGNNFYDLGKRLDCVDTFLGGVELRNDFFSLNGKTFIFNTLALGVEWLLTNYNAKSIDGLIFTPIADPYPLKKKWTKLFKWKDIENTTIDFYSVYNKESDSWKLYVQGEPGHSVDPKTQLKKTLFDVSKLSDQKTEVVTFETTFDNSNKKYHTNTVIEYKFDKEIQKFVPIRTRWDKTEVSSKHGNYYKVACDIWRYIQTPITKSALLKLKPEKVYKSSNESEFFVNMRKFHNQLKQDTYNKYTKKSNSLLELCSGRGGDLKKWVYNQIDTVHGFDIDTNSIKECKRRYIEECDKVKFASKKYKFTQMDVTESYKSINNVYSNIACNFGIHYLYKSEPQFIQLMSYLSSHLEVGGHFICTLVDSEYVKEYPDSISSNSREIISYYHYHNGSLKVYTTGSNYLTFNNEEHVLDYNFLKDTLSKVGMEVVEDKSFKELYEEQSKWVLEDYSRDISSLYRRMVFRKVDTTNVIIEKTRSVLSQNVNSVINLNSSIGLIKLESMLDLVQYINYYKLVYNISKFSKDQIDLDKITKHNILFVDDLEYDGNFYCRTKVLTDKKQKYTVVVAKNVKVTDQDISYTNYFLVLYNNCILQRKESLVGIEKLLLERVDSGCETESQLNEPKELEPKESEEFTDALEEQPKKKVNVADLKVHQLKALLKKNGLSVSGTKQVLIERLKEFKKPKEQKC